MPRLPATIETLKARIKLCLTDEMQRPQPTFRRAGSCDQSEPATPQRTEAHARMAESRGMRCKAGHDHEAMKQNLIVWLGLVHIGDTVCEAETIDGISYPYERCEQRNCACGSTLAITFNQEGKRL